MNTRQQAAADEIIKNQMRPPKERKTKKQMALDVGYHSTAPLNSDGVKKALARYGLTEKLITVALVDDIKAKPQDRVQELRLGSEILGMRQRFNNPDDNHGNKTLIVIVSGESASRYGITQNAG